MRFTAPQRFVLMFGELLCLVFIALDLAGRRPLTGWRTWAVVGTGMFCSILLMLSRRAS